MGCSFIRRHVTRSCFALSAHLRRALLRGWVPLFEEPAYEPGTIAHVTSFDLARDLPANDPAVLRGEKGMGQNVWPAELPMFRRDVSTYYDATSSMAKARAAALRASG